MARNFFREDIGSNIAENVALLAAVGSTGRTFGRSLMPRTSAGQAVATGLTGSVNYGLAVTSQSALWAGASVLGAALVPGDAQDGVEAMAQYRTRVRALAYGTYATTGLASRPLQKLVAQKPGESVSRGVLRGYLQRLEMLSIAGLIGTGVLDAAYSQFEAHSVSPGRRRVMRTGLILTAGAALSTALVHRERTRRAKATGAPVPPLEPKSVAMGVGTAVALTALGKAEAAGARGIGDLLEPTLPLPVGRAAGHAVILGTLGLGVWQGMEALYGRLDQAGSVVETLLANAPVNRHVSGGPASAVAWDTMSREGRRFAGVPLSTAEIAEVMGSAATEPVRVFVPLAAADTAQERARIALAEMESLGAFDRSVIVLCSPTGTGYINYVMAEAVEYLTRGDCAIVSTQYSLRPSFLSLDRVSIGRENAVALFTAVHERIAAMPADRRPRVVQFGESLGAHTGQDAVIHEGTAGFAGYGIDRALFIGTPDESGWAKQWRADPAGTDPNGEVVEVASFEEFRDLPQSRQDAARIYLISHHNDPITKFGPELALRRPGWLDPDRDKRPTGIPPEMDWRPLTTFFVSVSDVLNSMNVVPGQFGAEGHDYRLDLARFVSQAYDLSCTPEELERIEQALRKRELAIAESRLVADQVSAARSAAEKKLSDWGVDQAVAEELIDEQVARYRARGGAVGPEGAEEEAVLAQAAERAAAEDLGDAPTIVEAQVLDDGAAGDAVSAGSGPATESGEVREDG